MGRVIADVNPPPSSLSSLDVQVSLPLRRAPMEGRRRGIKAQAKPRGIPGLPPPPP